MTTSTEGLTTGDAEAVYNVFKGCSRNRCIIARLSEASTTTAAEGSSLGEPLKDTRRLHGHLLQLGHPAGPATQR